MAGLTVAHKVALAALLERCPETMLGTVSAAVAPLPGGRAAELRMMLADEVRDRARRLRVFGPLVPMFRPRKDGIQALTFPPAVLARLWKAASAREPTLLPKLEGDDVTATAVANRICVAAGSIVRDSPDTIWPAVGDPPGRAEALEDLAACLDLAPFARRGLRSLEVWLKRPDGDQIAELRLLLKDSAEIHFDGAQRVLEILFAHMDDAALILRIITQTSCAAEQESFLSESELAGFVDRLIVGMEARAARIEAFRPDDDIARVRNVIADLGWCADVMGELDVTLTLNPLSVWGKSVRDGRVTIARRLSALFRAVDKSVDQALPTERVQTIGRMTRKVPNLTAPVSGDAVLSARGMLRLLGSVRGPASTFGCEADRQILVEALTARLGDYADQALRMVHDGEVEDGDRAMKMIGFVAQCLDLIDARDAARTVRRRAAVTEGPAEGSKASSRAA